MDCDDRHSVRATSNHLDLLDIKIDNVDFKETDSGRFEIFASGFVVFVIYKAEAAI